MKTKINWSKSFTIAALLAAGIPSMANAQDKVKASAGGDIVSSYIWRGTDCGGISIQPHLSVAYKGFSLGAWGSVGLNSEDTKEMDFILGYTHGGLSLALTDYWFFPSDESQQIGYFKYAAHNTQHVFEITAGYDFGVMGISWNTNFAGSDYHNADGKRSYSTYIALTAPFKLTGLDWNAEVGLTPWEGAYADKFNVTNLSLKASKELPVTKQFSLPLFAQVVFNPYTQGAYFVFGLSL